jgi:hypothetical protein
MNQQERASLRKFIAALKETSAADLPLSKQQLVSRFNTDQTANGQPVIREQDPDVDVLFRKTVSDLARAQTRAGSSEGTFRPGFVQGGPHVTAPLPQNASRTKYFWYPTSRCPEDLG